MLFVQSVQSGSIICFVVSIAWHECLVNNRGNKVENIIVCMYSKFTSLSEKDVGSSWDVSMSPWSEVITLVSLTSDHPDTMYQLSLGL